MKKKIQYKPKNPIERRREALEKASTLQEAHDDLQSARKALVPLPHHRLPWEARRYKIVFRPVKKSGWICGQKTGKYHRPYVKIYYVPQ